jgi:hypothetical protein
MNELDQFLSTSDFDEQFSRAISHAAWAMFEATNINKDFLKREAAATGDENRFQTAKQSVQSLWTQEDMTSQLNEKAAQKVLNFLYLMEIREPGFTTADKLHAIHDLYVGNMLDTKFLSQVNSDTTPGQAAQVLASATEHQANSAKVYPDLTAEEEAIWNRVKVYHEFEDGFKWVYAVNADGSIASHIPSYITFKTMHHCGNTPDKHSNNQYWELRGPDGKAYLTVILSPEGKIEESKSWGNQPNKYRRMIQPYVKWFLKNKVTGVGYRYDYGYATHNNFGVKDFMGDDPEFIDYVAENKPELFGNTEKRIMFWKEAINQGVVTVDDIKRMFAEGFTMEQAMRTFAPLREYYSGSRFNSWAEGRQSRYNYGSSSQSIFGSNPFDVVCAACDGCPFSKEELKSLIMNKKVSLEEFANYDIHLLTPEMQRNFVSADAYNLHRLMQIASEVGTFEVANDIVMPLVETVKEPRPVPPRGYEEMNWQERNNSSEAKRYENALSRWDSALDYLRRYLNETNPPEKARPVVDAIFGDQETVNRIFSDDFGNGRSRYRYYYNNEVDSWLNVFARYRDLEIPPQVNEYLAHYLFVEPRKSHNTVDLVIKIGRPRIDALFANRTPKEIATACIDTGSHLKLDARNLLPSVKNMGAIVEMFPEYANIYDVLRPSLKLGYMCCAPRESIDVNAAVTLAVKQIRKGENIPSNPNAMLSATGAATMLAISRFPEILEQVTAEEIGDYVFPQADMIEHTYIPDGPMMLSEHLVGILKEAYRSYDQSKRISWATDAAKIFMDASSQCDTVKPGDPIFNEVFLDMLRGSSRYGTTYEKMTGYRFYPDIPKEQWDDAAMYISPNYPADAKKEFIKKYILPALNNGRFAENEDMYKYLVDFILDPAESTYSVLVDDKFRKRHILNRVKRAITERINAGEDISLERADQLNRNGLLNKDFLVQAQNRRFDEQSESDIDESISEELEHMCSEKVLKQYKKSRNFPYFVNELLRAILEQYDMRCSQADQNEDYFDAAASLMFHDFSRVADFILASPKTPTCLAAAKLARQSGLLDAYRMVADRFGPDKRMLRPMYVEYGRRGFTDRDLSTEFVSRLDKLDQLGKTTQKYKAEEGELPMKQK